MSLSSLRILLIVAAIAFCLIEFNRIQQADRRAKEAELIAKNAKQVVVQLSDSIRSADATNKAVMISETERQGRSESRKSAVADRIKEVASHEGTITECIDPALVSLLNQERADFKGSSDSSGSVAKEGSPASACVTVADLVEADRFAAAEYNRLADRHNRLVDEVTSSHCNSITLGSSQLDSSDSKSSDFKCIK